jgi:hypothetical protein
MSDFLRRLDGAERVLRGLLCVRSEQIATGYDASHDDEHRDGAIVTDQHWGVVARLGAAAAHDADAPARRRELQTAAALLVAEIERMDRAAIRARGDA